ncbi:MAG: type II toxin-antitoxin system VapC family toxin [Caldilineaceae bacterium]|nr:type II toxin-antitoxin system VapC family toxin [Caldilineaceae bacterium]
MIYLDTHVVVWYYVGDAQRFSQPLQTLMNQHDWVISPIVRLELQYLHEIERINPTAESIIDSMAQRVGLTICAKPFNDIISAANQLTWARDLFDRILVAYASLNNDILVTSDQALHSRYPYARW